MSPTSKAIFPAAPTPVDSYLGVSLTPHSPSLSAISLGFSTESVFSNLNVSDSWSSFLVLGSHSALAPRELVHSLASVTSHLCTGLIYSSISALILFLTVLFCPMVSQTSLASCPSGTSLATCLTLTHHRCPNPYHPSPISSHIKASPSTQVPRPQASETSSQACLSLSLHVAPVIGSSVPQSHYLLYPHHHILG